MNLPELPEPMGYVPFAGEFYQADQLDQEVKDDAETVWCFSMQQMRAYAEEAVRIEREAYREIVTLYQHSAMTDAEFVLRMIDFIEERSRTAVPVKEGPPHRVTQWGNCSVCRRDRIPGEACARKDCPDAPAAVPVPAKE